MVWMIAWPPMALEFLDALLDFLSPLVEVADDSVACEAWLSQLGHTAAISGAPELGMVLDQAAAIKAELTVLNSSPIDTLAGIENLLQTARSVATLEQALRQFGNDPARASIAATLGEDIMALLLATYLRRNHMMLFRMASILTLIRAAETTPPAPAVVQDGVTVRFSPYFDQFNFAVVGPLISNPGPILRDYYFPNNLALAQDAWTAAGRIFGNLGYLANAAGLRWSTQFTSLTPDPAPIDSEYDGPVTIDEGRRGEDGDPADDQDDDTDSQDDDGDATPIDTTPLPDRYFASTFPTFRLAVVSSSAVTSTVGPGDEIAIELQCSSSSHPGATPGYIVSLTGIFNSVTTFDSWRLTSSASGEIPAFVLKPDGFALVSSAVPVAGGAAQIKLEELAAAGSGPAFIVGSPSGTRLEIGTLTLEGGLSYDPSHIAAAISARVAKGSFVLKPSDGDSFLSSVLPSDGLTAQFTLGLTFSSDGGLSIQGGAGLDVTVPIGRSVGGVVTIVSVHLALQTVASGVQAEVSASAGLAIGPLQVSIDRIGVLGLITFPDDGGNFGPIDLGANFKPPSGAGLAIDAVGVSGGGFLAHDDVKKDYSGVLQLSFDNLMLRAWGLITTQVAGGDGYSLLAMVDADFPPIQLGWGFTLNGAGGLMAMHRTADLDALRAGLKADKLSMVLFQKKPIVNASQILGQLDALFPPAQGRFLFGPLALIGWGTPNLLTIALAVILELPEPVRILLLARLAVHLPSDSNALVRVNMDAVGVLDLSASTFALDAVLFDSKLMGFALSGGMALRADWSAKREFLLSIGGFHPQFTPPVGFPALDRIAIDMPSSSITKMRMAAYLAIASNSVQFGATLDVMIGVSEFNLSGHLGFDALLQIEPFHFTADISASIALSVGGDDLMSVGLDATLSGPAPWNIAGKFKIHLFFVTLHKHFSYTWGADTPSQPILSVAVLTLVQDALRDARNWGTSLPSTAPALASIRSRDAGTPVVHPLSQLEVHQRVSPLGLAITRFGSSPINGANLFTIDNLLVNGTPVWSDSAAIQDDFAPAQFFDLSDQDKLAGPSFEPYDAGVRCAPKAVRCGPSNFKTVAYETSYIDRAGVIRTPNPAFSTGWFFTLDLQFVLATGASGKATVWKAGNRRFRAPGSTFFVAPQKFSVASTTTLLATSDSANGLSWSAARAVMKQAVDDDPSLATQLQVVATHELAGA